MGVLGRGLAAAIAVSALGACYAPALRDCTIACASGDDCAGGQVCGSDGLCAMPEVAGRCGAALPGPDAAPAVDASDAPARDAPAVDAAPPPIDAGPSVAVHVKIEGVGSVVLAGFGTCSSEAPAHGDCTYNAPSGVARTARAVALSPMDTFTRWSTLFCGGQGATCSFTPFLATAITARFDRVRVQ